IMKTKRYAGLKGALVIALIGLLSTAMVAQAQIKFGPKPLFNGYYLVDLGANAGTTWSFGYGINNSGQAVGAVGLSGFRTAANKPFMPATSDDLGVLGSLLNGPDYRSYAYGINNNGAAVGESVATGGSPTRAFRSASPGAALESLNEAGSN